MNVIRTKSQGAHGYGATFQLVLIALACSLLSGPAGAGFLKSIKNAVKKSMYSFERQLGANVRDEMIKEHGVLDDPDRTAMVRHIGRRLARISDRKDIEYEFHVLNTNEVNAFAAPGGFIFVTRGLLDKVADENELAFVLSHEIGHVVRKHSLHAIERSVGLSAILSIFMSGRDLTQGQWADLIQGVVFLKHSKSNEFEADWQGIYNTGKAGYNPHGAVGFFTKLKSMEGSSGRTIEKVAAFFSTHPPTSDRITRVRESITSIKVQ